MIKVLALFILLVHAKVCEFKVSKEKKSWYAAKKACPSKFKGSKLALGFQLTSRKKKYWIAGKKKKIRGKKYCVESTGKFSRCRNKRKYICQLPCEIDKKITPVKLEPEEASITGLTIIAILLVAIFVVFILILIVVRPPSEVRLLKCEIAIKPAV